MHTQIHWDLDHFQWEFLLCFLSYVSPFIFYFSVRETVSNLEILITTYLVTQL
jgi:hypothetical protein